MFSSTERVTTDPPPLAAALSNAFADEQLENQNMLPGAIYAVCNSRTDADMIVASAMTQLKRIEQWRASISARLIDGGREPVRKLVAKAFMKLPRATRWSISTGTTEKCDGRKTVRACERAFAGAIIPHTARKFNGGWRHASFLDGSASCRWHCEPKLCCGGLI